ncbi:MAG: DDE-type integrase/transposase/recombinase [Dialister invisus]|uniref:DDE-type integrase/transposase/recombinase n=1 Tax=Dialister invisus TaxID=218538 RepID=UPI00267664E9|nr:DDE-type integrase/transposase/recombinase [Dialister invisus]
MKAIITEEMRYRERVVQYTMKSNNAVAARRYHTSRQQVQRWRKKYDGTTVSLSNKSTRPHSHPNQHTKEEIELIKRMHRRYSFEGLAQVYRSLMDAGYRRTYQSMQKQLRNLRLKQPEKKKYPKSKYKPLKGEYVEVDVKYVPLECIGFSSSHARYYQITGIDLYSRKRIIKLVNELSTYETSKFLYSLEKSMGFKIKTIQTDNGRKFCNDTDKAPSLFQIVLERLGIRHKRTRPYSPWQNGVVERSHRVDNEIFYARRRFSSEEEMYKSFKRYAARTNNICRSILKFKSPNEVLKEYLTRVA